MLEAHSDETDTNSFRSDMQSTLFAYIVRLKNHDPDEIKTVVNILGAVSDYSGDAGRLSDVLDLMRDIETTLQEIKDKEVIKQHEGSKI